MFRVKIRLVAGLLVVLLNVAIYLFITMPLAKDARARVEKAVSRSSQLPLASQKLHAHELATLARDIASRGEFSDWVLEQQETERRTKAFDAISQYDKKLRKENRKAHFFAILDVDGALVARDLDPKNMYKEKLTFARNIAPALQGKVSIDVWNWKNRLMRSAAAPILVNNEVAGVVVIAYDITAAEARQERDQFGVQVAYFQGGTIRASSFTMRGEDTREDAGKVSALANALLGSGAGKQALTSGKASDLLTLDLAGEQYLAITGPLPITDTDREIGFVVLCSLTEAKAPVSRVRWILLVMAIGSLLLVLGVITVVVRHYEAAEDKIELGVSEVINGDMEYYFEDVKEFEGLANAINVMLARLLGRPEPGEDMDEEEGNTGLDPNIVLLAEADDADLNSTLAQTLANEDEAVYQEQLFRDYVEARRASGLPVDDLTPGGLLLKLRANEALLKAKYKCQMVRFVVHNQAGRVMFKPVRIG